MPPTKSAPARKGTRKRPEPAKPPRGPLAPERVNAILKALDEAYPDAKCALDHRSPHTQVPLSDLG